MITNLGTIMVSVAVPVGAAAGSSLFAQGAITEQTPTTIGVVVLCSMFIGGLLWKAGREFQEVTESLKNLQKDSTEAKAAIKGQGEKLNEIDKRVIHIEQSCSEVNGNSGKHKCQK